LTSCLRGPTGRLRFNGTLSTTGLAATSNLRTTRGRYHQVHLATRAVKQLDENISLTPPTCCGTWRTEWDAQLVPQRTTMMSCLRGRTWTSKSVGAAAATAIGGGQTAADKTAPNPRPFSGRPPVPSRPGIARREETRSLAAATG